MSKKYIPIGLYKITGYTKIPKGGTKAVNYIDENVAIIKSIIIEILEEMA